MPSRSLLLLLTLVSVSGAVVAADTARGPITVEADRLELNQKTGISIYQGDVVLEREGMQLKAERLELHSDGKELQQAIADGEPAQLERTDPQTGQHIRARALHMEYHLGSGALELDGEAYLWRDGDEFNGQHLTYDARAGTVRASGDKQGNGRVRIILQPKKEADQ